MEVDPSSAASTSLAFVVFTRQVQEPRMAVGRGEEPRNTRNNSEPRMDTNGHEKTQEPRMDTNGHEKTQEPRMAVAGGEEPRNTRKNSEPRMDTNGLNHEWTRMTKTGVNHETHEIHEKTQEPRKDTNGHLEGDKGDTEKHRRCCVHVQILWRYKRICKKRRRR